MARDDVKIKSAVRCLDYPVGEVAHVIVDPLSLRVSHIVVRSNGMLREVPASVITAAGEEEVELSCKAAELVRFPEFKRANFLTSKEVEIAHLEEEIQAEPGEILVPIPALEKSLPRRKFFAAFINVLAGLIALPMIWPVLRFIMTPMYRPFDNRWWKIGNINQIKTEDVGVQFKFKKTVKDSVLEREDEKNEWLVKASPTILRKVYPHGDKTFTDQDGNVIWVNQASVPYVAFSGKCPHLGCGYKWRHHRTLGYVFLCPCHLSVYDVSGAVLDGPAPRPLDVLPIRVSPTGEIEVIDIEYKAGRKEEIRIA